MGIEWQAALPKTWEMGGEAHQALNVRESRRRDLGSGRKQAGSTRLPVRHEVRWYVCVMSCGDVGASNDTFQSSIIGFILSFASIVIGRACVLVLHVDNNEATLCNPLLVSSLSLYSN